MKRNRLGQSPLLVSEIGFGCMSLNPAESAAGIQLIHEAMDRGVNFFDTADLYHQGGNEELLGEALQGRRADAVIATKVGNRFEPGKAGWHWGPTKAYIMTSVNESLRRLRTEYIDLYQLHGGTLDDPVDEIIEAFEELQRQGVIRAYGISSIRPNVIREYVARSRIQSVMTQYSLLDRRPEETVLPLLEDHGVSAIVRGPIAQGLLSERASAKVRDDGYLSYSRADILRIVEQLQAIVTGGQSLSQAAIRYVLSHRAVATAVPGASSLQQLIANIGASTSASPGTQTANFPESPDSIGRMLSDDELALIRAWTKPVVYDAHR